MNSILKNAAVNAVATAAYIVLVALLMFRASHTHFGERDTVFIPIFMLMLFVFSASLTGFLMLGKPLIWYLDGKKKEALTLLGYTLAIFFVITVGALLTLATFSG